MLHVVPILCLLFFIGFVEYRLIKHIEEVDNTIKDIESKIRSLKFDDVHKDLM